MSKYEQNKKYAAKWNRENMSTLACTVRKETRDQFKAWAEARGLTVSGALSAYVRQCLAQDEETPDVPER